VKEYRAYAVGIHGHFIGFEPLVCAGDDEAIRKAERTADGHDIELWNDPPPRYPAASQNKVSKVSSLGAWQQIADGHSGPIATLDDHRIARLHFSLHGVATKWHPVLRAGIATE
jgi:hypothetical protein